MYASNGNNDDEKATRINPNCTKQNLRQDSSHRYAAFEVPSSVRSLESEVFAIIE